MERDGEETVVTGEVDEGCKREGERSCNPTRTKTLLQRQCFDAAAARAPAWNKGMLRMVGWNQEE